MKVMNNNMCGKKCWNCGKDGHSSGTCKKGCTEIKLFGVQINVPSDDGAESQSTIRKSKSLGNLHSCNPENAAAAAAAAAEPSGYLSDGFVHQSSKSHERKRGKPWSEDEHRLFLAGLEKLGKGDWKGIANNFVPSRSSTQVASHAQKYFNRLSATEKKRRRASVFDIPLTHPVNPPSNKADESLLQASSSAAAASKNAFELKGQASNPAPVVTNSERPPLSPMKRHGIPAYLPSMVYQPRVASFTKGFLTQTVMPTVSWVPVVNFSNQSNLSLPSIHGFVPQPSSVATLWQGSSSQPGGSAVPRTNNNELNLNIRKLTL